MREATGAMAGSWNAAAEFLVRPRWTAAQGLRDHPADPAALVNIVQDHRGHHDAERSKTPNRGPNPQAGSSDEPPHYRPNDPTAKSATSESQAGPRTLGMAVSASWQFVVFRGSAAYCLVWAFRKQRVADARGCAGSRGRTDRRGFGLLVETLRQIQPYSCSMSMNSSMTSMPSPHNHSWLRASTRSSGRSRHRCFSRIPKITNDS